MEIRLEGVVNRWMQMKLLNLLLKVKKRHL